MSLTPPDSLWLLPDLLAASQNPGAPEPIARLPGARPIIGPAPGSQELRRAALGEPEDDESALANSRSPAALAWSWSEMDERERTLGRLLPPATLTQWISGAFDHPRDGLTAGGCGRDTMAMKMAASLDPGMAPLRRALRAKTLATLIARPGSWGKAMGVARARPDHAALRARHPEIFNAIKQGAWRAGEIGRGAGLFIAGLGAFGFIPLAPLLGIGATEASSLAFAGAHAAALGGAGWGLFSMTRTRNHPDAFHGPVFGQVWGPSGRQTLAAVYPDLEEAGVFEVWARAGSMAASMDFQFAYEGLAKAGFCAQTLSQPIHERDWAGGAVGDPHLPEALAALFARQELLAEIPSVAERTRLPASSSPKRPRL